MLKSDMFGRLHLAKKIMSNIWTYENQRMSPLAIGNHPIVSFFLANIQWSLLSLMPCSPGDGSLIFISKKNHYKYFDSGKSENVTSVTLSSNATSSFGAFSSSFVSWTVVEISGFGFTSLLVFIILSHDEYLNFEILIV